MSGSKATKAVPTPEEVADEMAEKMRESVLKFIKTLREPSDDRPTITIDELEQNWDILDKETKKLYAEMVGRELSGMNERPLIDAKKENSKGKE